MTGFSVFIEHDASAGYSRCRVVDPDTGKIVFVTTALSEIDDDADLMLDHAIALAEKRLAEISAVSDALVGLKESRSK